MNLVAYGFSQESNGSTVRNAGLTGGVSFVAQSVALRGREGGATAELGDEVATALRASQGGGDKPHVMVAPQISHTLTAPDPNAPPRDGKRQDGSRTDRLPVVAFARSTGAGWYTEDDKGSVRANRGGTTFDILTSGYGVRRLTPRECERLQGFPDDWTAWGTDEDGERVELSDSARYRMLGNAVAVPVVEWIGRRIANLT